MLGILALVLALKIANRFVTLPGQQLPNLTAVPKVTVFSLLLAAAPIAGLIEEAAFRGYMQGPIERRCGLPIAILITGTMFALVHLDFTPILWLYYVAVAALYGAVTSLTNSILPAIVLHTLGNTYSNLDLLLHGRAEWQAAIGTPHNGSHGASIMVAGLVAGLVAVTLAMWLVFVRLSGSVRPATTAQRRSPSISD